MKQLHAQIDSFKKAIPSILTASGVSKMNAFDLDAYLRAISRKSQFALFHMRVMEGVLPYGEVYFRSAVFDPVRGYTYFGQDSRPDQIVKFEVAKVDPITVNGAPGSNGVFQLNFTNINGGAFTVSSATNLMPFGTNWTTLGSATEITPGNFQYTDVQATDSAQRFYRVMAP